jgi:hypothetical protein
MCYLYRLTDFANMHVKYMLARNVCRLYRDSEQRHCNNNHEVLLTSAGYVILFPSETMDKPEACRGL